MLATLGRFYRRAYAGLIGGAPVTAQEIAANTQATQDVRVRSYAERELLYSNNLYVGDSNKALLDSIFRYDLGVPTGKLAQSHLHGYVSPIKQIVDLYQWTFPGSWGKEMRVADRIGGRAVNPALLSEDDPVGQLWRWSNFDTEKQDLCYMAANFGTVGLRIVSRGDGEVDRRRVWLQLDHPERIADFREDERGNVTEVLLKYELPMGDLGEENPTMVEVEEHLTRDLFTVKYNGATQSKLSGPNPLGVCPYVILRHQSRKGYKFGLHSYDGSETIIHLVNFLVSHQGESVRDHAYPTWFGSAAGPAPVTMEAGKGALIYVQSEAGGAQPTLEPLVANLQHDATRLFWLELIDQLRNRQPEMNLNDVKLLSHTSGELLSQVLKPTEAALLRARANYDHALIRALMIGLSEMVRLGITDLGTGSGSVLAAQTAFGEGMELFQFAERPALPQTTFDKTRQIEMESLRRKRGVEDSRGAAGLVDDETRIGWIEPDPEKVDEILRRRRTMDVVPVEGL